MSFGGWEDVRINVSHLEQYLVKNRRTGTVSVSSGGMTSELQKEDLQINVVPLCAH